NTLPAITDSKMNMVSGSGTFSGQNSGLSKSTTYYARAYAINSSGTAYGSVVTFTTTDGTGPVALNPTMDTTIDNVDSYPGDTYCYVGFYDPTYGAGQAVLKFDFSSVEGTVQNAKFRMYVSGITNAA